MTQKMLDTTLLDAVVLVQLDIRSSELAVKVDATKDLPGVTLPPSALVSTGVKHYADPALKSPFAKLKKRGERLCAEIGFPLLKGWALPKEAARKLDEELRQLADQYHKEADRLEASLPDEFERWEQAHPGWEHLFKDRPTPAAIRTRYRFRHAMYRMRPAGDTDDDAINDALGVTSGSLLEAILDDVAASATDILEKTFEGRSEVTGRCIPAIASLGKKLTGFAFIDPLVLPVAKMIGEVIGNIGNGCGKLSVTHTSALRGLLQLLANPDKLRKHGAMEHRDVTVTVVEGNTTAAAISEKNPDAEVVVPPPSARVPTAPHATLLF